ncbi:MAG: DUF1842 domain-containing protein [Candidatus Sulfobium sp.]|jgi:hypothetical protein
MKKGSIGQKTRRLREVKAMRYAIVMVLFFVSFALSPLPAAQAEDLNVCISLSTGMPGAPSVTLDLFASYKAPTVYGLNGTALSTQATFPPTELSYVLSGTADITTTSAVDLSLTGTAEDGSCDDCIKEVVFHVVFDGANDRYTQIIRNAKDGTTSILTGRAEVAQSCGK